MSVSRTKTLQQLRPFGWAAGAWLVIGSVAVGLLSPLEQRGPALGWWLGLFVLSCLDLGAIAALVGSLVLGPPEGEKLRWGTRMAMLLLIKLGAWGVFALLLFGNRGIPQASLLSGLGTLIVVPLLGGFLWSFTPASGARD